MAFFDQEFSVDQLPESGSYDLLPAGWYNAKIHSADLKPTKSGDGKYIALRFDITGPERQGRVVFTNININNKNPAAEDIGRRQLGEIMRSANLAKIQDTDQLIGIELKIKVGIQKSEQYGDSNTVSGYKAIDGAMASLPAASKPNGGGEAKPATKAPWQK